jgi:hypothetical protein
MKEYDFTLKFNLQNLQVNPEIYVEQLYDGGCEDALIGIGQQGYLSLNFTREAPSAYEAVSSAITDVKNVIPQATLIEAASEVLGLTATRSCENEYRY